MEKHIEIRKYSEHFLNIVNELISTENTFNEICSYVQKFLTDNKETILKLIQENNIVFTAEELDRIISHFSTISSQPIQKLLKSDEEIDAFLKNYVEPLKDENIETDLLKRWTSISRLMAFYTAHGDVITLIDKNFKTTREDRLSIQSYFITPIQRLPRIALFFGEMLQKVKTTEAGNDETITNIEIMLEAVRGTLKTINKEILTPLEQAILKTETNKWTDLWTSNKQIFMHFMTSETIIWKASPEVKQKHFQKSIVHENHIATVFALIQIKRQLIKKESEKIGNKEEKLNEDFLASCRGFLDEIKEDVIPENNVAVPSEEYDFDIDGDDEVDLTQGMNLGKPKPPKEIHIDEEDRKEAEQIKIENEIDNIISIEAADANLKDFENKSVQTEANEVSYDFFIENFKKFIQIHKAKFNVINLDINNLYRNIFNQSEKEELRENIKQIEKYIEEKKAHDDALDINAKNIEALSTSIALFRKYIPNFVKIAQFRNKYKDNYGKNKNHQEDLIDLVEAISLILTGANATFVNLKKLLEEQPETFGIYKETIKNNLEIIEKALEDYKAQVTKAVHSVKSSPEVVVPMNDQKNILIYPTFRCSKYIYSP